MAVDEFTFRRLQIMLQYIEDDEDMVMEILYLMANVANDDNRQK